MGHIPVLFDETLAALQPGVAKRFLDCTAGGGGHTGGLLDAGASVLSTDADVDAVARVLSKLNTQAAEGRLRVRQAWLDEAVSVARAEGWLPLDGALIDLGLSSFQLDTAERGFALMRDGPLDMRFDQTRGPSAAEWIERSDVWDLTRALRDYGEVPNARRVAEAIWAARPIHTTGQLRDLVSDVVKTRNSRIHPATLVFQALRIVVNDELGRLERALPALIDALKPGGRLAVIAFHSLEDRVVKNVFRDAATARTPEPGFGEQVKREATVRLVNRDPMTPGAAEIESNPRSRSAKLRVVERL
jgi:16S rRNA (cytosine1402-N4)-methyltransferase